MYWSSVLFCCLISGNVVTNDCNLLCDYLFILFCSFVFAFFTFSEWPKTPSHLGAGHQEERTRCQCSGL